jgi:DNA processing protein
MDSIEIPLCDLPKQLAEIPHPPKKLFCRGAPPPKDGKYLVVVGSRNHSVYAQDACRKIISELAGTDIYIVSGLALGIDTVAHETALSVGLKTIAFPGSGLDRGVLYPASNFSLAERIVENGGALLSEFPENFKATPWGFPKRNRLMAGLAHAVLVVEATEKSGTLITARMALDYNRDVLTIPGEITTPYAKETNNLIRQGAGTITCGDDIREIFGIEKSEVK